VRGSPLLRPSRLYLTFQITTTSISSSVTAASTRSTHWKDEEAVCGQYVCCVRTEDSESYPYCRHVKQTQPGWSNAQITAQANWACCSLCAPRSSSAQPRWCCKLQAPTAARPLLWEPDPIIC
jgi:hypothetical protein